ncbi:MAG: protein kinase [Candidatus Melainabacteria bacterium]|nr:protein kinase [Candidatus Melainabacteria bacterium]
MTSDKSSPDSGADSDPMATDVDPERNALPVRQDAPVRPLSRPQPPPPPPRSQPAPPPGRLTAEEIYKIPKTSLKGKYEFLKVIGAGGAGVIYKARQEPLGRLVAVKMIHSHLMSTTAIKRFQQEARTVSAISHPNVIGIHDFGISEENQPYMVMDYIEGMPLSDYIKENGPLGQELTTSLCLQICDGLIHAHGKGVLHRDLKPSNLMVLPLESGALHVKILDFGLAKILLEDEDESEHLTRTGETVGTPAYMSPEQVMGKQLDHRTDIYSLGCLIYHCLTGDPPFIGETKMETMLAQLNNKPSPINEKMGEQTVDPAFDKILMKMLEKKPADRFQSMVQVKAALQATDEKLFLSAGELKAVERKAEEEKIEIEEKKPEVRSRAVRIVVLAAGAIVFSIGIFTAQYMQSTNRDTTNGAIKTVTRPKGKEKRLKTEDYEFGTMVGNSIARGSRIIDSVGISIDDEAIKLLDQARPMKNLKIILTGSPVTTKGMRYLADLKLSVADLVLARTAIDGGALSYIASLKPLLSLNVADTAVTDASLESLSNCTSLGELNLANTKISDAGLHFLSALPSLRFLSLSNTRVTDAGMTSLLPLTGLTDLELDNCAISDEGVETIARMKNIQRLRLNGTRVTKACLKDIARMKELMDLDLSDNKLDDLKSSDLMQLTTVPKLDTLRLHGIDLSGEEIVKFQRAGVCSLRFD